MNSYKGLPINKLQLPDAMSIKESPCSLLQLDVYCELQAITVSPLETLAAAP